MSEWISVEDELPLNEESMAGHNFFSVQVIVYSSRYGSVFPCEYKAGKTTKFWGKFEGDDEYITHWMPLPQPPK